MSINEIKEAMAKYGFRPLIGVNFCKPYGVAQLVIDVDYCFRPLIGVNFCKQPIA